MPLIRNANRYLLCVCAATLLFGCTPVAAAGSDNPCDTGSTRSGKLPQPTLVPNADPSLQGMRSGLTPVKSRSIVYDANQGICWLADANLAGHPEVRAVVPLSRLNPDGSAPAINPDGTMDWQTARNWVDALNRYDNGKGWLNHNTWQLPTTPETDRTCSSYNVDNFGIECTGGALGNLFYVGLAQNYPESVVPRFASNVWPFVNLQPGLYWSANANNGGEATFSFNTGLGGSNTTKYNFFHVLPMTRTVLGPLPEGSGVLPYSSGPAAGKAVYDTYTGISWTSNANLPAFDNFGVTATTLITADLNGDTNGGTVTVPLVADDGAVYLSAAIPKKACSNGGMTSGLTSEWIVAMNGSNYAGTNDWQLPCMADLQNLYKDMGLTAGDPRLEWLFGSGPFWRLQPGFYWACVRAANGGSNGPCDYSKSAPQGLEWSFNFDDGFEGTDLPGKQFYVQVYFPAP
jgi:hypothetical protein